MLGELLKEMGSEGSGDAQWPPTATGPGGKPWENKSKIEVFGDGGCRERIRDSAWCLRVLREVLGEVPELILESPEVPLELLGVILGHPESIRSSGFGFRGSSGSKIVNQAPCGSNGNHFEHTETILNCSIFNF